MLLCRSMERGETAAQEIGDATKGEVTVFRWAALIITTVGGGCFKLRNVIRLDLSSLRSVKECCRQISRSFSKVASKILH